MTDVFADPSVQRNIDMDLFLVAQFDQQIGKNERFVENQAKADNRRDLALLQIIYGVGRILALTIVYEIGEISRFDTVQQFASYARLVKCQAESAGKRYGTQGNKIGNMHLKWAFSEAAVLYSKATPRPKPISSGCSDYCVNPFAPESSLNLTGGQASTL